MERKEGATDRLIAGKWHIITLPEAIEYLEHDFLTNRFHVTHYGGCAVLFNKDTFFSDIKVSSFYLHDTRASDATRLTTILLGPGAVFGDWADVCGFINPPELARFLEDSSTWSLYNSSKNLGSQSKRSELTPRSMASLGLRQQRYVHMSQGNHDYRVLLKERSCPYLPPKKKVGTTMVVTIHFHLYRRDFTRSTHCSAFPVVVCA